MTDKRFRMKCDYCRRVLALPSDKRIPCTSCGHGQLAEMLPKNFCDTCQSPIYDNVDPKRKVTCWRCVGRRVAGVVHAAEGKLDGMAAMLRRVKEERGWSLYSLSTLIKVSKSDAGKMLRGQRPLNRKALDLVNETGDSRGENRYRQATENKQIIQVPENAARGVAAPPKSVPETP